MTASCGLARNYLQLFMTRVGVGVGEAALSPSALSMMSDYFPKRTRGRAIAVYNTGIYSPLAEDAITESRAAALRYCTL
jgi:MFS family permease